MVDVNYRCTRCGAVTTMEHSDSSKPPAAITCYVTPMCLGTALRETKIDAARRLVGRHQQSFNKLAQ